MRRRKFHPGQPEPIVGPGPLRIDDPAAEDGQASFRVRGGNLAEIEPLAARVGAGKQLREQVAAAGISLPGHVSRRVAFVIAAQPREVLFTQVESALVQEIPSIKVEAKEGEVFIYIKRAMWDDKDLMARIKRLAANVAGLEIQVHLRKLPK